MVSKKEVSSEQKKLPLRFKKASAFNIFGSLNRLLFASFKNQIGWWAPFILLILGFILYANSFKNEYALDDGIVIQKNEYVKRGIRGIPKILSTDAYDSFYNQMNAKQQLSGGRYRPLSVVTFAIEQELFGTKEAVVNKDNNAAEEKTASWVDLAFIRHFLNVAFYVLSVIVLFYFLRKFIFKENPLIAFIACLIFLIHPIHTEVVANIKSRDEILSFLFTILTFISLFRYQQSKEKKQLIFSFLFYFFALLSKEYAITLLLLIPILLYTKTLLSLKESFVKTIPFFIVAIVYLFIRFSVVGKGGAFDNPDVLNNPFKFATASEKWATKIELLNHYLKLLFYPQPLSSDYSYNTIPYISFASKWVWASIFIHLSMIVAAVVLFFKRNILSFALAFYLLHLFLISNLIMDLGATMGERLIYHSSFGFSLIIAVFINWILSIASDKNIKLFIGATIAIFTIIFCGRIIMERNEQWKNDTTLFIADVKTVPNSALVNGNAGKAYLDLSEKPENKLLEKELIIKAIYHLKKSVCIHKEYVNGYLNIGVAYFKLKNYDKARASWDIVKNIYPNNPFLKNNLKLMGSTYFNDAMTMGSKHPLEALKLLEKALEVSPQNADYWYNLGGVSYTVGDFEKARNAWTNTLLLDPNNMEAKQGMSALPPKNK